MKNKSRIGIITDYMDIESGGYTTYVFNLVDHMLKLNNKYDIFLIHGQKSNDYIYRLTNEIIIPFSTIIPFYKKTFWRLVQLEKKLLELNLDLVHDPTALAPFIKTSPFKKIVTLHDCTPTLFPQYHPFLTRLGFSIFKNKIKYCNIDKVIVDSKQTAVDLNKFLKFNKNNIRVIYLGVNNIFKPLRKDRKLNNTLLHKYYVNNFILSVGTLEPRKNLTGIIKAYEILKKNFKISHKLIIIGKEGWKFEPIMETIENSDFRKEIIILGYVSNEDLVTIYNLADCLVYPSFYEGFGLPPLEAMACGCPVVASNTSSLPEVVGNAGILINPYDAKNLANAIKNVLRNKNLRNDMIEKGLKQAGKFTWGKCAKETLKVYDECLKYKL